jgi:glycosyltransferase involved in cell wall biosynthesis
MFVTVGVPTLKSLDQLQSLKKELESTVDLNNTEILFSCQNASASINRNWILDHAKGDFIIQVDDDMKGFFPGWVGKLIQPFNNDTNVIMTSARLMKTDGNVNFMIGLNTGTHIQNGNLIEVTSKSIPSACICIRKNSLKYDEAYIGCGYEDTDYCLRLSQMFPIGKVIVIDDCRIIHLQEMKNELGDYLTHNKQVFLSKWGHL